MNRDQFFAKWRAEAETMRRRGVMADGAALCEEILGDLESVLKSEGDQLLSLREAAAWSGYSADHLGRMIRTGEIRNAGRKGSPRIRACDLPRRPKAGPPRSGAYDPAADAREILAKLRTPRSK